MPTIAVSQTMPQAPARRVGSHDRVFYGGVAALMALMAIVGFAPTFYLRLFSVASVPLRLAISGTATWIAIAQALTR